MVLAVVFTWLTLHPGAAYAQATETSVETRASEIFPFSLGKRVLVNRVFGPVRFQSVTVVRRAGETPATHSFFAQVEVRNLGARQVMPTVRVMLYAQGRYIASCYMPPRSDPYQEVEPGQRRIMVGGVTIARGIYPDAFRIDDVPYVHAYTCQEGVSAEELFESDRPIWKVEINRSVIAECTKKVPRGHLFETPDGTLFIRLHNREMFLLPTLPPERLDPKALEEARKR